MHKGTHTREEGGVMSAKRIITMLAAVVLTASLIGCGTQTSSDTTGGTYSAPSATPTPEKIEVGPQYTAAEQQYLDVLHKRVWFRSTTDAKLLRAGRVIDQGLDVLTVDRVLQIMLRSGIPAVEAGYLMYTTVATLCPEHMSEVEAWMDQVSGTEF